MAGQSRTALHETGKSGEFQRKDSVYRNWVKEGGEYAPEAGRYTLYISYACPWANRCLAVRNLKGLEDAIDLSVTHPTWQRTRPDNPEDEHTGWTFASPDDPPFSSSTGFGSFDCRDCIPDPNVGAKSIRDLYDKVDDTNGKYTVPVLWDKETSSIVNNESADIVRMLNADFNSIAKCPEVDLYPEALRADIDAANEWIYPTINNGVYRCGFAQSQSAYETAFSELFASLDRVEDILSKNRYLTGSQLTEADIRLFMTLIRFDEVYVVYFKTNRNRLAEMPNIKNYVQELYQMPGIKEAINIYHIKTHYFTSHPRLNYYSVVPHGGAPYWEEPHDRERLS